MLLHPIGRFARRYKEERVSSLERLTHFLCVTVGRDGCGLSGGERGETFTVAGDQPLRDAALRQQAGDVTADVAGGAGNRDRRLARHEGGPERFSLCRGMCRRWRSWAFPSAHTTWPQAVHRL